MVSAGGGLIFHFTLLNLKIDTIGLPSFYYYPIARVTPMGSAHFLVLHMPKFITLLAKIRWSRLLLLLLPLFLYASGIIERYGLRDDYSTLREARESGDIIFQVNASHGRPVYGWLLEYSFAMLDGINGLPWARLVSALLVGLLAWLTAWTLEVQLGWNKMSAWSVGGWLALLPATQIYIHWAICWPIALAAVLGVLAFILAQWGYKQTSRIKRALAAVGAFSLLLLALLDYQPNALLFVMFIAAGWITRLAEPNRTKVRWAAWHLGLVLLALTTAYVASQSMFALSSVERSPRFSVETNFLNKLEWSAAQPLQNALALEVLADDTGRTEPWHQLAATATGATIIAFGLFARRKHGWSAAGNWWAGFLAFALLAYAVSFVAAERWATYRTLLPLSGVVIVYLVHAVSTTLGPRRRTSALLCAIVGCAALLAHHESHEFLAEEQESELARLETASHKVNPETMTRVTLLLPHSENPTEPLHYLDEYGSLSMDADWCAKEMLLLLLHEQHPAENRAIAQLKVTATSDQPAPGSYDVLLDLRDGARSVEPGMQAWHQTGKTHN